MGVQPEQLTHLDQHNLMCTDDYHQVVYPSGGVVVGSETLISAGTEVPTWMNVAIQLSSSLVLCLDTTDGIAICQAKAQGRQVAVESFAGFEVSCLVLVQDSLTSAVV